MQKVTNQGRLNFMVCKERFTANVFLEFLRRLLRQNDRRVYLIIDRHPVHRSPKVKNWVAENEERIRLVFLPSYSPEIHDYRSVWIKGLEEAGPEARPTEGNSP